jgi:hypothetical protein
MIKISEDLEKRLVARLKQVLSDKKGRITLTHDNGEKEGLIVGETNGCVYIYNTEPDLITSFEIEGGQEARDINIKNAALFLYNAAKFNKKISKK